MKGINRYIILIVVVLCSCKKGNKWDCLNSTGEIIMEERAVTDFNEIRISDNINVILTQDTVNKVVMEAGENLLEKIEVEVNGVVLTLKNNNKCNWTRSYKKQINAYITVKDLATITHDGYGRVTGTNTIIMDSLVIHMNSNGDIELDIDADYFHADTHETGDLILSGKVWSFGVWTSGNTWIKCENLVSKYAYIQTNSTGDCNVHSNYLLDIVLNSIGNVNYSGNPSIVTIKNNGKGSVNEK